jgi:hypothetical protein
VLVLYLLCVKRAPSLPRPDCAPDCHVSRQIFQKTASQQLAQRHRVCFTTTSGTVLAVQAHYRLSASGFKRTNTHPTHVHTFTTYPADAPTETSTCIVHNLKAQLWTDQCSTHTSCSTHGARKPIHSIKQAGLAMPVLLLRPDV